MCIIIIKNKGVEAPYKGTLKRCFKNNPDGAGYCFAADNSVFIKKGFMNFKSFYNSFKKDIKKDTPSIIHFRITTQGGIKPEFTHPFPLSANYTDLKELDNIADVAIAHNGIIELTSSTRTDATDTMEFIAEYLSLILDFKGDELKNANVRELIEKLGGFSRFAFLKANGEIVKIGAGWVCDFGGLWFSNSTYKKAQAWASLKSYYYGDDYSTFWEEYYNENGGGHYAKK